MIAWKRAPQYQGACKGCFAERLCENRGPRAIGTTADEPSLFAGLIMDGRRPELLVASLRAPRRPSAIQ